MVDVMLCGASDTRDVQKQFARVTNELGGEPWHYLSGRISYQNKATASWVTNSESTVRNAHLCVFVILKSYGEITWTVELQQALSAGIPFVILCLEDTYREYLALKRWVDVDKSIPDAGRRNLVQTLSELESTRQFTVVQFEMDSFAEVYRREAARCFARGLQALAARAQREALAALLHDPTRLTTRDLVAIEELAVDEFEDKTWRKYAVEALAERGSADPDTVLALVNSREQGIQRLAVDRLADLHRQRPPDPGFLDDCVRVANTSDDAGLARRLIPALFDMDVPAAIRALASLDLSEIGTRRRLSGLLVEHENICRTGELRQISIELFSKCVLKTEESGWIRRAVDCLERLKQE
ncbi:hypothetical protein NONO_c22420 [Nocardia nova SH22a]|uniref:Uncharacterized protein n=1 Tax=Nocardia nova SH22a TaxID=1415166 RepID=W5TCG4_9NOCA|nr:hypothetical protein [Nocardia nova]AHH17040.1 hypothetical protein NONO_c22420 [Nocardia nova SH22a]